MNTQAKLLPPKGLGELQSTDQRLLEIVKVIKCTLSIWRNNARQRRQLAKLSTSLLKDIGVTEWERQMELKKPFWKN